MKETQVKFEALLRHLVEAEETGERIIDEYYPLPSKEREELLSLFKEYLQKVRGIVEGKAEIDYNEFPFVIIGCQVSCKDLSNGEMIEYTVAPPFGEEIEANDVSCLSPIGRTLLLKTTRDEISVQVPMGILHYKIHSVKYNPNP